MSRDGAPKREIINRYPGVSLDHADFARLCRLTISTRKLDLETSLGITNCYSFSRTRVNVYHDGDDDALISAFLSKEKASHSTLAHP